MAERTTEINHEATMQTLHPGCKTDQECEWSNLLNLIAMAYQVNAHVDGVHGRPVKKWQRYHVPSLGDIQMGRRMGKVFDSHTEMI